MGRLDGKVAFVTASGGAIAGATARLFGKEGAAVCCVDIVEENVKQTASDINAAGGNAMALKCDVTDDDAVKTAVKKNCYGIWKTERVLQCSCLFRETPSPR